MFAATMLAMTVALAQSSAQETTAEDQTQGAGKEPGFGEASLKFDILEAQLQTLRKKMQLQSKRRAEQTKEWNEHYEKVKQHIEAWDHFVDSHDVE